MNEDIIVTNKQTNTLAKQLQVGKVDRTEEDVKNNL